MPYQTLPSIAESKPLRLLLFFLLYGAQGVAFGLFTFAVPGWLAANGASAVQVGAVVTTAGLPWSLKFLNGFLMDRFTFLPMGRRRAWLIGGQAVVLAGLVALAIRDPLVSDVALLSGFGFLLNLAVNFQDVATDGMAADLVPEAEQARTNGVMFGGQAIGIAATAGFGGLLLAEFGMRATAIACGVYILLVLLLAIVCRERAGERLLPWTAGAASPYSVAVQTNSWGQLFQTLLQAMVHRESLLLGLAATLAGVGWGLGLGVMPLVATQQAGLPQASYSALTGSANLVGGMLGLLAFGMVADMFGPLKLFRVALALNLAAIAAMLLLQSQWRSPWPITLFIFAFLILRVMQQTCNGALSMGLCRPAVAASQMTIFNTFSNLGASIGSLLLGPVDSFGGHTGLFGAMAGFYLLAFGFALAKREKARFGMAETAAAAII